MDSRECPLTPTQREILAKLASGMTGKQVARVRGIAHTTLRSHTYAAYKRLGAANIVQAILIMIRHGWIELDDVLPGDYQGPAYTTQPRPHRQPDHWVPTPAQRIYIDAFHKLLYERAESDGPDPFLVLCQEKEVPDRRSKERDIESTLLKMGHTLTR